MSDPVSARVSTGGGETSGTTVKPDVVGMTVLAGAPQDAYSASGQDAACRGRIALPRARGSVDPQNEKLRGRRLRTAIAHRLQDRRPSNEVLSHLSREGSPVSKFLKALERAEQQQALRRHPAPSEAMGGRGPAVPEATPHRAPRSPHELPRAVPTGLEEHLVSLLAPTSFEAEQYRALRHLIEQLHKSADLSVVAVSSPDAGDGKTLTAINLAGTLAQAPDARVLLVDADLRGGALATRLGLGERAGPGLVDAILDANLTLEKVAQVRADLNLSVLPAGRLPSAPYEVLKSPRVGELLAEARQRYDYIVLDTPPLVSFPDCRVIGRCVDGFLITVAAHRTSRKLLEEALNVTEPAKIVGLVFNGDDRHLSRDTYSTYASMRSFPRDGDGWWRRLVSSRSRTRRRETASDD